MLRLFSGLGDCKQFCYEHGNADIISSYCFHFLWIYSQKWMAGPCGSSSFNFLRNHHSVFHSNSTNLHSHQQCTRVPLSLHSNQHLFSPAFLVMHILIAMGVIPSMDLICISLMTRDVEHLFMSLLVAGNFKYHFTDHKMKIQKRKTTWSTFNTCQD